MTVAPSPPARLRGRPGGMYSVLAGDLIEFCLVVSVATIMVIRFVLELSGYPQLGGGGLHIAHVLYGGLMMIGALIVLFALLNPGAQWVAAFVGGVGFGFFIDEVGKFITSDVDYFYRPAVAVMYVVFILLFMVLYAVRRFGRLTPQGALTNALSLMRRTSHGDVDGATRAEVHLLLDRSDPAHPAVPALRAALDALPERDRAALALYARTRTRLVAWYGRLTHRRLFVPVLVTFFVLYGLGALGTALGVLFDETGLNRDPESRGLAHIVQGVAALFEVLFVAIGLVRFRASRLDAYRWLRRGILVSLLVVQVFVFYWDQFAALVGLSVNLLMYFAVVFMMRREEDARRHEAAAAAPTGEG